MNAIYLTEGDISVRIGCHCKNPKTLILTHAVRVC